MKFIAATNNAHKLAEMRRILVRMGHTVLSQREAGVLLEPEETGTTFEENAAIKAQAICEACQKPTIADDSGLCVDALDGAPGVYSARYAGVHGDDGANNRKLLAALQGVPAAQRTAHFTSAVCVWLPGGRHAVYVGHCPGAIDFEEKGENGFGYDPLFIPDEVGMPGQGAACEANAARRTYAQLSAQEKDAISHRARALALMERELPAFLADTSILGAVCGPACPRKQ